MLIVKRAKALQKLVKIFPWLKPGAIKKENNIFSFANLQILKLANHLPHQHITTSAHQLIQSVSTYISCQVFRQKHKLNHQDLPQHFAHARYLIRVFLCLQHYYLSFLIFQGV